MTIEEYAIAHKSQHPVLAELVWRCSGIRNVTVIVTGGLLERFSGRGSPTPMWAPYGQVRVVKGYLNKAGGLQLWRPSHFARWMHEVYHVHQYLRLPWYSRFWRQTATYSTAVFQSRGTDCWWAHEKIPFEHEAIAFDERMFKYWLKPDHRRRLNVLEEIG